MLSGRHDAVPSLVLFFWRRQSPCSLLRHSLHTHSNKEFQEEEEEEEDEDEEEKIVTRAGSQTSECLWKEYFRDPSQWWDIRYTKTSPRAPDFKHKITQAPLWIDRPDTPAWVRNTALKKGLFSLGASATEEGMSIHDWRRQKHSTPQDFVLLLKTCAEKRDVQTGSKIHSEIISTNSSLESDLLVGTTLVNMYAKCGYLSKAQEVFDKLHARDVVSWGTLLAGYAHHGRAKEALNCFGRMQREGVPPDAITFVCILKACASLGALEKGQEIHAEIARKGSMQNDVFVGSALVSMYAKCDSLEKAQEVFDKLSVKNTITWNALIAGYAQHGRAKEALNCYWRMKLEGVSPNAVTFICSLKACGSIGAIKKGQEIHAEVSRKGLLGRFVNVGNALVDMYAKCGSLAKAQDVFDKLSIRDQVSWNTLMAAYTQYQQGEAAVNCFRQMQLEGVPPTEVTFVCALKACGSIGDANKGQEIHVEISRNGILERELNVGNALVDMYLRCGLPTHAQEVFDKLPVRNVISWTIMIAGYSQVGKVEIVFQMFEKMIEEGIKPDLVTFVSVLNACSHAGLVEKGLMYFESMTKNYNILPAYEHQNCIIDLLGRAGQLEKAVAVIKKMPLHSNIVVWLTLLGACQKWGNLELGRQAFQQAVQLDEKEPTAYVTMSNIYLDAGMLEDASNIEAMRVENEAWIVEETGTKLVDRCESKCTANFYQQEILCQNVG